MRIFTRSVSWSPNTSKATCAFRGTAGSTGRKIINHRETRCGVAVLRHYSMTSRRRRHQISSLEKAAVKPMPEPEPPAADRRGWKRRGVAWTAFIERTKTVARNSGGLSMKGFLTVMGKRWPRRATTRDFREPIVRCQHFDEVDSCAPAPRTLTAAAKCLTAAETAHLARFHFTLKYVRTRCCVTKTNTVVYAP